MAAIKFHTMFDLAPRNKRILDSKDNVDRLSYIDSTLMIKRFIAEGQNLQAYRSQGLYKFEEALKENNHEIIPPVYETDPAIAQSIISEAEKSFKTAGSESIDSKKDSDPAVGKGYKASGDNSDVSPASVSE